MAAWQIKQLEKMSENDPSVIEDVIHHFQASNPARLKKLVIGAYLDKDINLGKAAELLNVHREELRQSFLKKGIPIYEGSQTVEELKAEIATAIEMRPSYLCQTETKC